MKVLKVTALGLVREGSSEARTAKKEQGHRKGPALLPTGCLGILWETKPRENEYWSFQRRLMM